MLKRILALALAMVLASLAGAVGEEQVEQDGLRRLRLGSSVYTVMIDDDFVAVELPADGAASGQVGSYQNDATGLYMDVYQYAKAGAAQDLAHFTMELANTKDKVEVVWPTTAVGDIDAGCYWAVENVGDVTRETATYIMDSADCYVALVFRLPDDEAGAEVWDIMESLKYMELKQIRLGDSQFTLTVPDDYREGEISEEDAADDQVAYWYSDASLLDFDVYQFSKQGVAPTLAEYAEGEAATYPVVSELVTDGEINLVPVAWYRTVEEFDEGEYDTITYIIDGGDDYLEVVFWLDGPTAQAEADFIIHNLIDESKGK